MVSSVLRRWLGARLPVRRSQAPALRFAITFALLAATLLSLYYFPYPQGSAVRAYTDAFLHGYAATAGAVLARFEPFVRVSGQDIIGRYSLRIVKTCDAMDITILLVSAMLAWPCPWARRATGTLVAILVLFVVNVARICALYYVGVHAPSSFEFMHLDLLPAFLLLVAVGVFLVFTDWANKKPRGADHAPG